MLYLLNLPNELLAIINNYLDNRSRCRLGFTCKSLLYFYPEKLLETYKLQHELVIVVVTSNDSASSLMLRRLIWTNIKQKLISDSSFGIVDINCNSCRQIRDIFPYVRCDPSVAIFKRQTLIEENWKSGAIWSYRYDELKRDFMFNYDCKHDYNTMDQWIKMQFRYYCQHRKLDLINC